MYSQNGIPSSTFITRANFSNFNYDSMNELNLNFRLRKRT